MIVFTILTILESVLPHRYDWLYFPLFWWAGQSQTTACTFCNDEIPFWHTTSWYIQFLWERNITLFKLHFPSKLSAIIQTYYFDWSLCVGVIWAVNCCCCWCWLTRKVITMANVFLIVRVCHKCSLWESVWGGDGNLRLSALFLFFYIFFLLLSQHCSFVLLLSLVIALSCSLALSLIDWPGSEFLGRDNLTDRTGVRGLVSHPDVNLMSSGWRQVTEMTS